MKTRCLRKGRNTLRMSLDQKLVEILRGPLCLCSCVCMHRACVRSLYSCMCMLYSCVHIHVHQFKWTQDPICIHMQKPCTRISSWYRALADDAKTLVHETGFEPILCLLPESSTNAILVQTLAERWWDTTHTFHFAMKEMIVTPHDFHQIIDLWCDSPVINFAGELGTELGIELLRQRYKTETVSYFDLEMDQRPLPQETPKDCAQMAKTFLLYILGAYLFANYRQMVSLRLLALFHDSG